MNLNYKLKKPIIWIKFNDWTFSSWVTISFILIIHFRIFFYCITTFSMTISAWLNRMIFIIFIYFINQFIQRIDIFTFISFQYSVFSKNRIRSKRLVILSPSHTWLCQNTPASFIGPRLSWYKVYRILEFYIINTIDKSLHFHSFYFKYWQGLKFLNDHQKTNYFISKCI